MFIDSFQRPRALNIPRTMPTAFKYHAPQIHETPISEDAPNKHEILTMPLKPRVLVSPQKFFMVTTPNSKAPLSTPVSASNSHSSSGGEARASPRGGASGAKVGEGGTVAATDGAGVGPGVTGTATPAVIETESVDDTFCSVVQGEYREAKRE